MRLTLPVVYVGFVVPLATAVSVSNTNRLVFRTIQLPGSQNTPLPEPAPLYGATSGADENDENEKLQLESMVTFVAIRLCRVILRNSLAQSPARVQEPLVEPEVQLAEPELLKSFTPDNPDSVDSNIADEEIQSIQYLAEIAGGEPRIPEVVSMEFGRPLDVFDVQSTPLKKRTQREKKPVKGIDSKGTPPDVETKQQEAQPSVSRYDGEPTANITLEEPKDSEASNYTIASAPSTNHSTAERTKTDASSSLSVTDVELNDVEMRKEIVPIHNDLASESNVSNTISEDIGFQSSGGEASSADSNSTVLVSESTAAEGMNTSSSELSANISTSRSVPDRSLEPESEKAMSDIYSTLSESSSPPLTNLSSSSFETTLLNEDIARSMRNESETVESNVDATVATSESVSTRSKKSFDAFGVKPKTGKSGIGTTFLDSIEASANITDDASFRIANTTLATVGMASPKDPKAAAKKEDSRVVPPISIDFETKNTSQTLDDIVEVTNVNLSSTSDSVSVAFKKSYSAFGGKPKAGRSGTGSSFLDVIAATDSNVGRDRAAEASNVTLSSTNDSISAAPKKSSNAFAVEPKAGKSGTGSSFHNVADFTNRQNEGSKVESFSPFGKPTRSSSDTSGISNAPGGMSSPTSLSALSSLNLSEISDRIVENESTNDEGVSHHRWSGSWSANPEQKVGLESFQANTTLWQKTTQPNPGFPSSLFKAPRTSPPSAVGLSVDFLRPASSSAMSSRPSLGSRRPRSSVVAGLSNFRTEVFAAKARVSHQKGVASQHELDIGGLKAKLDELSASIESNMKRVVFFEVAAMKNDMAGQVESMRDHQTLIEELKRQVSDLTLKLEFATKITQSLSVENSSWLTSQEQAEDFRPKQYWHPAVAPGTPQNEWTTVQASSDQKAQVPGSYGPRQYWRDTGGKSTTSPNPLEESNRNYFRMMAGYVSGPRAPDMAAKRRKQQHLSSIARAPQSTSCEKDAKPLFSFGSSSLPLPSKTVDGQVTGMRENDIESRKSYSSKLEANPIDLDAPARPLQTEASGLFEPEQEEEVKPSGALSEKSSNSVAPPSDYLSSLSGSQGAVAPKKSFAPGTGGYKYNGMRSSPPFESTTSTSGIVREVQVPNQSSESSITAETPLLKLLLLDAEIVKEKTQSTERMSYEAHVVTPSLKPTEPTTANITSSSSAADGKSATESAQNSSWEGLDLLLDEGEVTRLSGKATKVTEKRSKSVKKPKKTKVSPVLRVNDLAGVLGQWLPTRNKYSADVRQPSNSEIPSSADVNVLLNDGTGDIIPPVVADESDYKAHWLPFGENITPWIYEVPSRR
jgi:hypothetical protein